ncbi:MAG TPA: GntR family transcriptional regulator [Solirubrobacteraceae bacterium]|jgi:DNA-binding transcriptional regulator YhcF (GntR family)|nr:GntR family transcriptional regulator [Solirubrobacteraceae bacterium]
MSHDAAGSSGLNIRVDRNAEIPIGVQLAWALRSRVRDGRLEPGQRLPGLREMAEATGVNVNTVRSVYQRLEQEGLIDSQQGSGTFVAATPQQVSSVTAIAADAAREARETGVDPREVAAALYVTPAAARQPADDEAERRRTLRGQIATLERTLGEIEAKHPGVAPPRQAKRKGIGPTLLHAAELEQVRTMLVRRLATVQAAIDGLGSEAGAAAREAAGERRAAASGAAARKRRADTSTGAGERPARAKPASRRTPRPGSPMRPAPEGA